jgi:hypothetical protein
VSEFPIIYYVAAQLYKLFGPREVILRVINLLIFWIGLLYLFKLSRLLLENNLIALIPPLFLWTSPFVVYYGANFLPNVPALSVSLIAWYYFFAYWKTNSGRSLILAFLWVAIAALLKVSAALSGIAFAGMWIMGALGWLERPARTHYRPFLIGVVTSAAAIVSWVIFAKAYNEAHGTGQNLLGIIPIWEMSIEQIKDTMKILWSKWSYHFHHPIMGGLMVAMGVYALLQHRRAAFLVAASLLLTLGSGIYMLLFFDAFYHHDYYLLNNMIAPTFWLITFLYLVRDRKIRKGVLIATVLIIGILLLHTRGALNERYHGRFQESLNDDLFTITPYLRSIGIERTDRVVSVPDLSPNISLYLMNNPGWTEAFNGPVYNINHFAKEGAKYLIVNDSSYLEKKLYQPFTNDKIGQYRSVSIYRIGN